MQKCASPTGPGGTRKGLKALVAVAALVVLWCLAVVPAVSAITFPIHMNAPRCFTEEIPSNTDFKIGYVFKPGYGQSLEVALLGPTGLEVFRDEGRTQASHTLRTTNVGGDHRLCFSARVSSGVRSPDAAVANVAFTFKVGTDGIDYKNLATKEKLKPMEVQLRVMEDAVRHIHGEFIYYKDREAELRSTNEHMTAKVVWMAVLVIVIFVVFSYLQLRHLKSYFRKKRMID